MKRIEGIQFLFKIWDMLQSHSSFDQLFGTALSVIEYTDDLAAILIEYINNSCGASDCATWHLCICRSRLRLKSSRCIRPRPYRACVNIELMDVNGPKDEPCLYYSPTYVYVDDLR